MREQQPCCSFLLTDELCVREISLRLWGCPGHGTQRQGKGIQGFSVC